MVVKNYYLLERSPETSLNGVAAFYEKSNEENDVRIMKKHNVNLLVRLSIVIVLAMTVGALLFRSFHFLHSFHFPNPPLACVFDIRCLSICEAVATRCSAIDERDSFFGNEYFVSKFGKEGTAFGTVDADGRFDFAV